MGYSSGPHAGPIHPTRSATREEGRAIDRTTRIFFVFCLLASLAAPGCVGSAWKAAQREDTPAAYYRFMRSHPDSKYAARAQEHLDFLKLKRNPSLDGYASFREKYPTSELLDALMPILEPKAFEAARAQRTPEAYRAFLDQFPGGALHARGEGNAAYLEAAGFGGRPDALRDFARTHPESDFAAEAARSADTASIRERSHFERVGLVIEISPATPEAARLRKAFLDRAHEIYDVAGVELVTVPEIVDANVAGRLPQARLTISHREQQVQSSVTNGELSRSGMMATTRVTLRRSPDSEPIFDREFTAWADPRQYIPGTSVVFSTSGPVYWDQFFVPVATWQSDVAVRPAIKLTEPVADLDAAGDRVVVLYEDGRFQLVELANPAEPVVLTEYQRPKDFKKWSGVRILGDRIALFGEEGIEFVGFGHEGPKLVSTRTRNEIGTVFAIEPLGDRYIIASARGLLMMHKDGGEVRRVVHRVVKGLALVGDALIFTDGDTVYVSTLELLGQKRVLAQLRMGKEFAPGRVRALGKRAVVIGQGGVLVVDLTDPRKPGVLAKLPTREAGHVRDAAEVAGRIFLLGDRGLQMMDASGTRLADILDLKARGHVAAMGRHLVAVGKESLQVVDSTPLTASGLPASPVSDPTASAAPAR